MANSTIEVLRKNVKKYRLALNLTQEKLSEISGISCDYLTEIERGKRTPSLKRIILIAVNNLKSGLIFLNNLSIFM